MKEKEWEALKERVGRDVWDAIQEFANRCYATGEWTRDSSGSYIELTDRRRDALGALLTAIADRIDTPPGHAET